MTRIHYNPDRSTKNLSWRSRDDYTRFFRKISTLARNHKASIFLIEYRSLLRRVTRRSYRKSSTPLLEKDRYSCRDTAIHERNWVYSDHPPESIQSSCSYTSNWDIAFLWGVTTVRLQKKVSPYACCILSLSTSLQWWDTRAHTDSVRTDILLTRDARYRQTRRLDPGGWKDLVCGFQSCIWDGTKFISLPAMISCRILTLFTPLVHHNKQCKKTMNKNTTP